MLKKFLESFLLVHHSIFRKAAAPYTTLLVLYPHYTPRWHKNLFWLARKLDYRVTQLQLEFQLSVHCFVGKTTSTDILSELSETEEKHSTAAFTELPPKHKHTHSHYRKRLWILRWGGLFTALRGTPDCKVWAYWSTHLFIWKTLLWYQCGCSHIVHSLHEETLYFTPPYILR